ncbi:45 kDa calcium-binding protein [Toxorhynchites rutilus septentrionalis]|uniref:45 kDa calcium-binding protein n=1 Tax=Toxorhynchites rutilus septentrionalis TaxID=329112 RepID=UPI0024785C63|nr:45 kDa calcium-binding protein [Toxorhynchites rutilus septentrionalis]
MVLIVKILRNMRIPRWSTILPILFYLMFIICILMLAFPMGTRDEINGKRSKTPNEFDNSLDVVAKDIDQNTIHELTNAFDKADTNDNKYLTMQELAKYINFKIRDHIDYAIRSNPTIFVDIDQKPRDGLVSWDEYQSYALRDKRTNEGHLKTILFDQNKKNKQAIARDKALWMEAARTDPMSLTLDEFLSFRHPESSTVNLLTLVDDILHQFDMDGDDRLTETEFSDVLPNGIVDTNSKKIILSQSERERREEFTKVIDKNRDGKADQGELLSYVDPRHPRYAIQEAASLFNLADKNNDKRLTLQEIMAKSSIFVSSKMINTADSFHDEF